MEYIITFLEFLNLKMDGKHILIHTLLNRQNITFVTSDHDSIAYLFNWVDSISQELVFKQMIIKRLGDKEKRQLLAGKKFTFFLDYKEFSELNEGTRRDILNYDWKKDGFCFRIKFWDNKNKKYFNSFYLNFNDETRELFLNLHGQLDCPFGKNNTHGNFITYLYWWPTSSIHNISIIKVLVSRKGLINKENKIVSCKKHDAICKYAISDLNNQLDSFSGFRM